MNTWTPLVFSFLLLVCKASKPKAHDGRCRITPNITISKCSLQRWYLDKETKQCLESCNPVAPFSSKIECEGTCRNGGVCHYPMTGASCFGEVFPVYIFNPYTKRCFLTYDCSYSGNKFPTLGECQRTCEKPAGQQQFGGSTATTHIGGSAANSNQAVGRGQAITLPPQSTLVTGISGAQTANARGSTILEMSSTPVSGQTNNANASLTDQVLLPQSRNPAILQQMQQIPTEQQDVTYATGSSQQACSPPCNFNVSFLQQGALQVNLTAVKIQASPKRPTPDRRCKVIATLPTYKCGQKWFFNKRTRTCLPSCSRRAPFRSKIACDGVCRSVGVCDFPMASIGCFREVHEVFIYNPNQNSCFKAYDCSYFGNKFPTLQQCQKTCRKGAPQQHLAGSGGGTPLASTPIQNAGSTVGLQPALSLSGTSLGPGLFGTQTRTGAAQQQVATVVASSAQPSGSALHSGSSEGDLPAPSLSATSRGTGLVGQNLRTAQVSTSSSSSGAQVAGSPGGLLAQQLPQIVAGVVAEQPAVELTKPVSALSQTTAVHPVIQKPMVSALSGYGISSEDKATLDVKSIKK